jgi:hypothetical protein
MQGPPLTAENTEENLNQDRTAKHAKIAKQKQEQQSTAETPDRVAHVPRLLC